MGISVGDMQEERRAQVAHEKKQTKYAFVFGILLGLFSGSFITALTCVLLLTG